LDFRSTAALCELMTAIVSVDTSVAHLGGALGVRTLLALPQNCDWRWMLYRDDSPWYASVKLFRQAQLGDWSGVLARIAADLRGIAVAG
jgi:ADP-heptose:LPS heptosyltransferase